MNRVFDRRDVLRGGLITGAGLAASGLAVPAFAQDVPGQTVPPYASGTVPSLQTWPGAVQPAPVLPVRPPSPVGTPAYTAKILASAKRQTERLGTKLWRTDVVGIADFSRPSWEPRLHFANLQNGTIRSFLLAHGKGSDLDHTGWLQTFSNQYGSLATSRGAYLTCEWYTGKYGTSIRLVGLDPDNATALQRMIVMHSAWYVDAAMIEKWGKLGRSDGCFAMSRTDFNEALWHLSGGRLLFADRIV
jgi:hypothetical protein